MLNASILKLQLFVHWHDGLIGVKMLKSLLSLLILSLIYGGLV
jgi:hypothetical protein